MAMPESTFLCWVNVSRLGTADEVNAYIIKEANVVVNAGHPVRRTKGRTPADCIRSLPGGRADGDGAGACQSRTHEAGKGEGGFLSNGREKEISGWRFRGGQVVVRLYPCLFSWYSCVV